MNEGVSNNNTNERSLKLLQLRRLVFDFLEDGPARLNRTNMMIGEPQPDLTAVLGMIPSDQIPNAIMFLTARLINGAPVQVSPPVDVKPEPLLTVPEVAQQLRLAKGFVYELIRQGQITAIRNGKRHIRVTRRAVDAYVNRQSTGIDPRK
jgi:excisionase family DNA binding protein